MVDVHRVQRGWEVTPAAPWGVVLVPTEEGRALTADGPCGAEPPVVFTANGEPGWGRWMNVILGYKAPICEGLPLRWDHALVPEGLDRAERVWCAAYPRRTRTSETDPDLAHVLLLARGLEADGLCRVVLLDLVDGAVLERAT